MKKGIRIAAVCGIALSSALCIVGFAACNKHVHKYTDVVTAPTCVAQGYTKKVCDCGESYVNESSYVPATGHSLTDKVFAPTCEAQGYSAKVCERCDYSVVDETSYVPATGHTYKSEWKYEEDKDGSHWHEASCEHTSERSNEEKHSFLSYVTQADCGTEGYTTRRCKCGYGYIDESTRTPKKEHAPATNWSTDASYHWHATNCIHQIVSEKAEHTFNSNNTCTECGYKLQSTQGLNFTIGSDGNYALSGYEGAAANAADIVIPAYVEGKAVTMIKLSALSGHQFVKSVAIPNTVTKLENQIFENCPQLEKVHFPSSLTSLSSSYMFNNCPKLTTVEVDEGNTALKVVENFLVFNGQLYTHWGNVSGIPNDSSITSVGNNCFKYATITQIDIPVGITSIGESAFQGCTSLTTVTGGAGLTSIGGSAFQGCTALQEFTVGDNVTKISTQAFSGCTSLRKVHIGAKVSSIHEQSFNDCSALTELTVASGNTTYQSEGNCLIVKKDHSLLRGCNTSVIPATVTKIGKHAFRGAYFTNENFVIPDTVTAIGDYAFYGSTIKTVTIPSSITTIEQYTFAECTSLTTLDLNNVVTIKSNAFKNCTALETVVVPESVTQIQGSFVGCTGITSVTFEVVDGWKFDSKTNLSDMNEATKIENFTSRYYWKRS